MKSLTHYVALPTFLIEAVEDYLSIVLYDARENCMTSEEDYIRRLAHVIRAYLRGEASRDQSKQLFTVTVQLVYRKLNRRIRADADSLAMSPLRRAESLVAITFYSSNRSQSPLQIALIEFSNNPDTELVLIYERIVVKLVQQQMFKEWPQRDRLAATVYRNARFAINTSPNLHVWNVGRDDFVAHTITVRDNSLNPGAVPVPIDMMASWIARLRTTTKSLKSALELFLLELAEHPQYQWFVPFDDLFASCELSLKLDADSDWYDPDLRIRIATVCEDGIIFMLAKIQTKLDRYVADKKLSIIESKGVALALTDLAKQWCRDSFADYNYVYFEYLADHIPDLTREHYYAALKVKFEHVAPEAKGILRQYLRDNL
jgi:hypothetical protein